MVKHNCVHRLFKFLNRNIIGKKGGHFSLKRGQFSLVKVVLGGQISLGNFVQGDIIFRGTIKTVTPFRYCLSIVTVVSINVVFNRCSFSISAVFNWCSFSIDAFYQPVLSTIFYPKFAP